MRFSLPVTAAAALTAAVFSNAPVHAWQMQTAPLMTDWAQQVSTNSPLPEYPRPQMVRTNWLNLNGLWQFQAGATNVWPAGTGSLVARFWFPFRWSRRFPA